MQNEQQAQAVETSNPHVEYTMARIAGAPPSEVARLKAASDAALTAAQAAPPPEVTAQVEPEPEVPEVVAEEVPAQAQAETATTPTPEEIAAQAEEAAQAAAEAERLAEITNKEAQDRFRFKNDEDRAVAQLSKALGISIVDAAKIVEANRPKQEVAPTPQVVTSPAVQALEETVATIGARLEELGSLEGLWNPEIAKLTRDYAKAEAALAVAQSRAEDIAVSSQSFEAQRAQVFDQTVQTFPDMANRDSAQYLLATQLAERAQNPSSPDYEAGTQLDAPRYFAEKAAKLLGKPAGKPAIPVKAAVPPETTKPGPASGTRQTLPPNPAQTGAAQVAAKRAQVLERISGGGSAPAQQGPTMLVV